jgi:hypothetical protein
MSGINTYHTFQNTNNKPSIRHPENLQGYFRNFGLHSNYIAGSLASKRLNTFLKLENLSLFIETGTNYGNGVLWATKQKNFTSIMSVELDESRADYCKNMFVDNPVVSIEQGDSVDYLDSIIPTIKTPCLIYLDAHYSGGISPHNPNHPVPLVEESNIILEKFYDLSQTVVLVDDVDCWDRSMIDALLKMYAEKNIAGNYLDDSIIFCNDSWIRDQWKVLVQ